MSTLASLLVLYKALHNQVRFRDSASYKYLHGRRQSLCEKGPSNINKTKVRWLYTQFFQSKPKFSHVNFPLENTEINLT